MKIIKFILIRLKEIFNILLSIKNIKNKILFVQEKYFLKNFTIELTEIIDGNLCRSGMNKTVLYFIIENQYRHRKK